LVLIEIADSFGRAGGSPSFEAEAPASPGAAALLSAFGIVIVSLTVLWLKLQKQADLANIGKSSRDVRTLRGLVSHCVNVEFEVVSR
jgi:hypothetical protein